MMLSAFFSDSQKDDPLGELMVVSIVGALVLSLLADPVVRGAGIFEVALGAAIVLLLLSCVRPLFAQGGPSLAGLGPVEMVMIALAVSFALAGVIGLAGGRSFFAVGRSVAPYALAFVGLPLIFSRKFSVNMRAVMAAVLVVGLAQACYQIILFTMQANTNVVQTLMGRITLIDARVTLPLAAAANCVALALVGRGRAATAFATVAVAIFGLATLVTLTRTLVVVYGVSAVIAVTLWVLCALSNRQWLRVVKNVLAVAVAWAAVVVIALTPPFQTILVAFEVRQAIETTTDDSSTEESARRMADMKLMSDMLTERVGKDAARQTLEGAKTIHDVVLRILQVHGIETLQYVAQAYADVGGEYTSTEILASVISQFSVPGSDELGGGRISDEWLPALETYRSGNVVTWLFGVGAGTPFFTASGDPRTYIHNLPIYLLLYNGATGVALYLLLQLGVAWGFVRRVQMRNDFVAFACLSMLGALNGFALLFAVHKLVAFNLLMAVVLIAYLKQEKSAS